MAMTWDPQEYLRFADQRGRPFADLIARVAADDPREVVDLGCGPGNLTRTLAQRWPSADVLGLDSSPEMIGRAEAEQGGDGARLRFAVADLRHWQPDRPVDVLVSNATLQWVPGHLDLLGRLVACVRPGGWFAFQVPGNFGEPSHTEIAAVRDLPRWRDRFAGMDLAVPAVAEPAVYVDLLAGTGALVDVWETTYLQLLQGEDAVLTWLQGTALRPVLSVLDDDERVAFLADLAPRLRGAYPRRPYGTVLPYRRIFAVARTGGPA